MAHALLRQSAKQIAFICGTRKDFGRQGRNYQTCLIIAEKGTNDKSRS